MHEQSEVLVQCQVHTSSPTPLNYYAGAAIDLLASPPRLSGNANLESVSDNNFPPNNTCPFLAWN